MGVKDVYWASDDDLQAQIQRSRQPGRRMIPHEEVRRRLGLSPRRKKRTKRATRKGAR